MATDTLLRHWALLRAIPQRRDATTGELHQRLRDEGFRVEKRTVERDLLELAGVFPILLNDKSRPYGWRWDPACKLLDVPGMDPATALSFKMAEEHLRRVMPQSALAGLQRHFARAGEVLAGGRSPLADWPRKVRIIARGQRLEPPATAPEIHDQVYQALLEERRFHVRYRTKPGKKKEYEVSPLGLVVRDQVVYVVCTLWEFDDVVQLVLHRMLSVELLDKPIRPAPDFDLQRYVEDHHFDYPEGGQLRLEALFEAGAAQHLAETRLSSDQELITESDGRVRVRATVANTQQLRWWLLGFGDQVEVVGPEALRTEFSAMAERLAARYGAAG